MVFCHTADENVPVLSVDIVMTLTLALNRVTCHSQNNLDISLFRFNGMFCLWGTGIRGLMRGMATLPQGNQELLVVRDKVGRPPGELGVSKSM